MNDQLINRIQKLLRLAENNPHDGEREQAFLRARALAIQNDIDIASIDLWDTVKKEEKIIQDEINLGRRFPIAQKYITRILANHFKVKCLFGGGRFLGRNIIFIGTKTDIEIASYINSFLNQEFVRLWHNYRDKNPEIQTKDKGSFFFGVQLGLQTKLQETEKEVEKETFENFSQSHSAEETEKVNNNYALVKINHSKRLEDAVNEFYPKLGTYKSYTKSRHNQTARTAGFQAGQSISLHKGIKGGQKQIL